MKKFLKPAIIQSIRFSTCIFLFISSCHIAFAQGAAINTSGAPADPSAMLDVSGVSKGVLINRMTTSERDAIVDPADGLQIFNLTTGCFDYYFNENWYSICGTCPAPESPVTGVHVPSQTDIVWNWNTVSGADGYKWNTSSNYNSATDVGTATTYTQSGLSAATPYTLYVWAYNECGHSDVTTLTQTTSSFVCGSSITDARDGQTYPTVLVGTQCWLAKNLNYNQSSMGSDWCYNNDANNCTVYGRLYDFSAATQGSTSSSSPSGVQGVCPSGWYLPSNNEYTALETFLGGNSVAGGKIKEAGTTHWNSPNTGATNSSGMTALPGGHYSVSSSTFFNLGSTSNYWTATQFDGSNGWAFNLANNIASVNRNASDKSFGFSVRCLKQ